MGNWWSPSWKGKLERGEPLPPDLELTEEMLEEMGVAKDEASAVLRSLYQHKRKTWGLLLVLVEKGEERLKMEVGDEVAATRVWNFFREYSAKGGGVFVPSSQGVTTQVFNSLLQGLDGLPSLEDLNSIFSQSMTPLIPVPTWLAEALFKKATVNQPTPMFKGTVGCVRASDTERTALEGVFHNMPDLDVGEKVIDRIEDQVHQLYDIFFQQILAKLLAFQGVTVEIDRNATEGPDKIEQLGLGLSDHLCHAVGIRLPEKGVGQVVTKQFPPRRSDRICLFM